MDEYVSRQDVITTIRENGVYGSGYSSEEREDNVVDMIESVPAADVRPVVLCRDCIYAPTAPDDGVESGFDLEWPHNDWPNDNPCPCKCGDKWYSRKPAPDFFCANGVKRSGNE